MDLELQYAEFDNDALREECDRLGIRHSRTSKDETMIKLIIAKIKENTENEIKQKEIDNQNRLQMERERLQVEKEIRLKEIEVRGPTPQVIPNGNNGSSQNYAKLVQSFDEKSTPIHVYLDHFERTMTIHEVDKAKWTKALAGVLTGKALDTFSKLRVEDLAIYDNVKRALLDRYQITPEHFRKSFREIKREGKETFFELAHRLRNMCEKWLETKGALNNPKVILEEILLEQFFNVLSDGLKVWIRDRMPKSLDEASRLADQYVASREGVEFNRNSSHRNSRTKFSQYSNLVAQKNAQNANQTKERVGNAGESKITDVANEMRKRDPIKCYNCKEFGHISLNCRKPKVRPEGTNFPNSNSAPAIRNVQNSNFVNESKEEEFQGHPNLKDSVILVKVGGKEVQGLVDSGASHSFVKPNLIKLENFTGKSIYVRQTFSPEIICLPLATIFVECEIYKGNLEVGVSSHLPYDCLLGCDIKQKNIDCDVQVVNHVLTRSQKRKLESNLGMGNPPKKLAKQDAENPIKSVAQNENKENSFIEPQINDPLSKVTVTPVQISDLSNLGVFDATPQVLSSLQRTDSSLGKLFTLAREGSDKFIVEQDLLYRQYSNQKLDGNAINDNKQICVPKEFRVKLLNLAHGGTPLAGHFKSSKTAQKLQENFYWPGLQKDVREFCDSCVACQRVGTSRDRKRAPMIEVPIVEEPWSKIFVDLTGPLPETSRGNKMVLSVICAATRYCEAVPLPSGDTQTVVDALIDIFARLGYPREIQTDQGTTFVSRLIEQLWRVTGVKHTVGSVFHPESQGIVERFHGTLKQGLRALGVQFPDLEWDEGLKYVLFAIRTTVNSSTGFSPGELMFGRKFDGPLNLVRGQWECGLFKNEVPIEYVTNILTKHAAALDSAVETQKEKSAKRKKNYDRKTTLRTFSTGDLVMVLRHDRKNKLDTYWSGPYKILKRYSDVNYAINRGRDKHQVFHINQLKPFVKRPVHLSCFVNNEINEPELPLLFDDDDEISDFTTIVNRVENSLQLTENQKREIVGLLSQYEPCFNKNPGKTQLIEHSISLNDDKPFRSKPYLCNPKARQLLKSEIDYLVGQGLLEPCESEYSSPLFIIDRPGKSPRVVCDFKALNSKTKFDTFPVPNADQLIDRLVKAKYITVFDLSKGYFQVPLAKESQKFTCVTSPFGTYQWKVLPQGLSNAPATFMRLVDKLLRGCEDFALGYLDDLCIFSESFEEHIMHLEAVLNRIREANLTIKPSKVQIAEGTVEYLGRRVGAGTVRPQDEKIRCINNFPRPTNKKELRRFLGMVSYYQRHVRMFSELASPLTDMLRKKNSDSLLWNEESSRAFEKLRTCLSENSVLVGPDYSKPFIINCDASKLAVGCILSQLDEEGKERPIAYASKKLLMRERNYSTIELEMLSILFAIEKFKPYIWGMEFQIYSDHNPLKSLEKRSSLGNGRLTRWLLSLHPYRFKVFHRPGRKNQAADCLSRIELD